MRKVYEWVDSSGDGVIADWPKLQPRQRAKLESKVAMLRNAEVDQSGRADLPPGLLAGPNVYDQPWIYKLKIQGNVKLRPMLCLGPIDRDAEWTILARAVERDNNTAAMRAAAIEADVRRQEILVNPRRRRLLWEDDDDSDN